MAHSLFLAGDFCLRSSKKSYTIQTEQTTFTMSMCKFSDASSSLLSQIKKYNHRITYIQQLMSLFPTEAKERPFQIYAEILNRSCLFASRHQFDFQDCYRRLAWNATREFFWTIDSPQVRGLPMATLIT